MKIKKHLSMGIAGTAAGAVNGLFGAGGGMILVPLLTGICRMDEGEVFPSSVSIILPICIVSLVAGMGETGLPLSSAWPYLLGSAAGGLLAGWTDRRIPVIWLHRGLGLLILWGGVRYLC